MVQVPLSFPLPLPAQLTQRPDLQGNVLQEIPRLPSGTCLT